ncbi:MAG TPA: YkgJ family cysteine cluster protein [Desulfomonilaceae bacterium]|nr:YkgJ family cysteine cluster protein [Desulfomonilaceae bacterium]
MEHNKAEVDFFFTALKEEARSILREVGSSADPHALVTGVLADLQALAPHDNDERSEEEVWTQIRQRLLAAAYATRPHCIRCGTCCTKGSPTLHREDIELFTRNILRPVHVMTIREGEPAYSGRTEKVEPAAGEMIKIREKPETKTCIFFETGDKSCSIYESRPAQCKFQECWNADNAGAIAGREWLSRKNLLEETGSFWEIVTQHEERCSYSEFSRAMARLAATRGQTVQEIVDLLGYDHYVREFVAEKFELDPETMSFFFGRPLSENLRLYGLKLEPQPDGSFMLSPAD